MIRLLLSPLGGLFSWITTAAFAAALSVGAVLYVYGTDLPSHESLASYQPPTISRIYSTEGPRSSTSSRASGGCSCRSRRSPIW